MLSESRLREILAQEFEKDLPLLRPGASEHIETIRTGKLTPGLTAAVRAMQRAVREAVAEVEAEHIEEAEARELAAEDSHAD